MGIGIKTDLGEALFLVVDTTGGTAAFTGGVEGGQQNSRQNSDDRNDDEKFNKSKAVLYSAMAEFGISGNGHFFHNKPHFF